VRATLLLLPTARRDAGWEARLWLLPRIEGRRGDGERAAPPGGARRRDDRAMVLAFWVVGLGRGRLGCWVRPTWAGKLIWWRLLPVLFLKSFGIFIIWEKDRL
jgi:hypothetical protein